MLTGLVCPIDHAPSPCPGRGGEGPGAVLTRDTRNTGMSQSRRWNRSSARLRW